MQRRAAAMYVIFFLVIAVGSLTFITLVDAPDQSLDEYDFQVGVDENFTVEGTEYTVSRIDVFSASVSWIDPEAEQSEIIRNESTIEIDGSEFVVQIPAEEEPESFFLQELYPEHDLDTVEINGVTYVVIEDEDEVTLVREEEYLEEEFGPRERLELGVGDTFTLDRAEATVTVESIASETVDVSWVGPTERSLTISRGEPEEIGGTTYGVNFVGDQYLQFTTDVERVEEHEERLEVYEERRLGFWAIGVLSIFAAILLGGLSYLPRRR